MKSPFFISGVVLLALMAAACTSGSGGDGGGDDPAAKTYAYVALDSHMTLEDTVAGFSIDEDTGTLTEISGSPYEAEYGASFVAVHPAGKFVYVTKTESEYTYGFAADPDTGALTPTPGSPYYTPEPRGLVMHPSGKFVYFKKHSVVGHVIEQATGALTPMPSLGTAPEPVYGLAFNASGQFAYVSYGVPIGIQAFAVDGSTGTFTPVPGSPFDSGYGPAGIALLPSGRVLYVTDDDTNEIYVYLIDPATGALTPAPTPSVAIGDGPAMLAVHPSGGFAYVISSGILTIHALDPMTGAMTRLGRYAFSADGWWGIAFDPSGKFLYVTDPEAKTISTFSVEPGTGVLSAKAVIELDTSPMSIGVVRIIR